MFGEGPLHSSQAQGIINDHTRVLYSTSAGEFGARSAYL